MPPLVATAPHRDRAALVARLRSLPPLAGLSPQCLAALVEVAVPHLVRQGETALAEGTPTDRLHLVLAGRLKLCRALANGRSAVLALLGPGDLFGTVAALGGGAAGAAVVALEASSCLELRRDDLFALLERRGELVGELLPLLTRGLSECGNCLVELTCYRVEARLAQLLARLAAGAGVPRAGGTFVPLPLSRRELAEMTGTTVETAIRVMSRWGKQQLVETRDDGFLLRDPAALERLGRG